MAKYLLQFSAYIEDLSDKEKQWLMLQMEKVPGPGGCSCPRIFLDVYNPDALDKLRVDSFHIKPAAHDDKAIWIYAKENGDPDAVAILVQRFLKKFRPNDCWGMVFSLVADEIEGDAFTGGYLFVTAEDYEVSWAEDALNRRIKRFRSETDWHRFD